MSDEHLTHLLETCDYLYGNFDGSLNDCELVDCAVMAENEWRA